MAPGFTLTDQFGKRVSLSTLRGKVVVVAFNDQVHDDLPPHDDCLAPCEGASRPGGLPGRAVGIGANPDATQVKWVRAYSRAPGCCTSGGS